MDTYVQLKYRHSKIPEFYSKPKKNSIKGMDFITRLYKCQGTNNNYTEQTTHCHYSLSNPGFSERWLRSRLQNTNLAADQKTWTQLRLFIKRKFANVIDMLGNI
jgi:hypothetical protein